MLPAEECNTVLKFSDKTCTSPWTAGQFIHFRSICELDHGLPRFLESCHSLSRLDFKVCTMLQSTQFINAVLKIASRHQPHQSPVVYRFAVTPCNLMYRIETGRTHLYEIVSHKTLHILRSIISESSQKDRDFTRNMASVCVCYLTSGVRYLVLIVC